MRKLKYILLIMISFFIFNTTVLAESSAFTTMINMEPEIVDGKVNVLLGYMGEEVMVVDHYLSYDHTRLKLLEVVPFDNFKVDISDEKIDGKYSTFRVLADSDYSFKESNYAVAIFEVKDNFKNMNTADVFVYNVLAASPVKQLYRNTGNIATLIRNSANEMYFTIDPITDKTKGEYWWKKYWIFFALLGAIIVLILVLIISMPSKRKKEFRDSYIDEQIRKDNYDKNRNFKIDDNMLDSIGKDDKAIDMTQAILVNKNVKPFGDSASRFEEENGKDEKIDVLVDPFSLQANDQKSVFDKNDNDDIESLGMTEIKDEPKLIQIASTSFEDAGSNDVENVPLFEIKDVHAGYDHGNNAKEIELPKLSDDNNSNNNNGSKITGILILMLLSITFGIITPVKAEDIPMDILIRECILGKRDYSEDFDLNGDKKVTILDLLETKNLENVNFEYLMKNEVGFADTHTYNNKPKEEHKIRHTYTTTKRGIFGIGGGSNDSTTKKTSTTKPSINTSKATTSTNTEKTTKESSASGTTVATTKSTTKSESNNKTTTKVTTKATTKTEALKVTLTLGASNGYASVSSNTYNVGSDASIGYMPNQGHIYDRVDCQGSPGSYDATSHVLYVRNIQKNTKCTVYFKPRTDIKVTIRTVVGNQVLKNDTATLKYGDSKAFSVGSDGYIYKNYSCTGGRKGTYDASRSTFTVSNVDSDFSCSVVFEAGAAPVLFKYNTGYGYKDEKQTPGQVGSTYRGSVTTTGVFNSAKCNGKSVSLNKSTTVTTASDGSKITLNVYTISFVAQSNNVCYFD